MDAPADMQSAANCVEGAPVEKVRTQQASSAALDERPPTAPGAWARQETADYFDRAIERRWNENEFWASNRALARLTKHDEKVIRQLRDGRKALPVAMLLVLPPPLVTDVLTWVQDKRALTPHRRGLPMLLGALERIERPVAAEDKDETLRALTEASRRINERIMKLAVEGQ